MRSKRSAHTMYGSARNDEHRESYFEMKTNDDTICAISTPPGVGGIAVIRVSGKQAIEICDKLWTGKPLKNAISHTAHFGEIRDCNGSRLDECVATVFKGPKSFTSEDTVELSVHGSLYIQRELLRSLCSAGARLAEAGEFTRRAFTSGRFDLAQAEAVADVIAADSRASHRLAVSQMRGEFSNKLNELRDKLLELVSLLELELDFSEEDVEFASRQRLLNLANQVHDTVGSLASSFSKGDAIKRGISVVIIGETNAGKSTLLNKLLHDDKAIVSDVHGTTRDIIEDTADIEGICFRFIDTAGIRDTDDKVESLGIERALKRMSTAKIALWVIDANHPEAVATTAKDIAGRISSECSLVAVINKCDLTKASAAIKEIEKPDCKLKPKYTIEISAHNGTGIDKIESLLVELSGAKDLGDTDIIITNARHYQSLLEAQKAISRAIEGLNAGISGDFIAQDLRETIHHLSTITGSITTTDILQNIFSKFCIGK